MKLTWQSIGKSMDTQIDHAHIRIKTCIENDQNGSGCVPGPWTSNAHHQTEIKTVRGKLDFWNLFENWSLRDYLKIGFLGIKCKNENFRN